MGCGERERVSCGSPACLLTATSRPCSCPQLKKQQEKYYTNKTGTLLSQLREQRAQREDTWSALSPRSRATAKANAGATGTLGSASSPRSSALGAAAYKPVGYTPSAAYKSTITVKADASKTANSRGRYGYGYRETDHGYGYKKMPRTGSYVYRTLSPATAQASNAAHPPRTTSELEFVKLASGFELGECAPSGCGTPTVPEDRELPSPVAAAVGDSGV